MIGSPIGGSVAVGVGVGVGVEDGVAVEDIVTVKVDSATIEVGVIPVLAKVSVGIGDVCNDGDGVGVAFATWQAERISVNNTRK